MASLGSEYEGSTDSCGILPFSISGRASSSLSLPQGRFLVGINAFGGGEHVALGMLNKEKFLAFSRM